jgi:hypothetical protein
MPLHRKVLSSLLVAALTACGGSDAQPEAPDDDSEGVLGGSTQMLGEHRTATVTPFQSGKELQRTEVDPRATGVVPGQVEPWGNGPGIADGKIGVLEALRSGCNYLELSRNDESIRWTYPEVGRTSPGLTNCSGAWSSAWTSLAPAYPNHFTFAGEHSGSSWPSPDVYVCMASALMKFAKAVQPQYIVGGALPYISDPRAAVAAGQPKDIWFASSSKETLDPATSETIKNLRALAPDPGKDWPADKVLYRIEVPRATDAATWALLATDFYREAAVVSGFKLHCNQEDTYEWRYLLGGSETYDDHFTVLMSEAVSGMNEAAELAQQSISAAADQNLAKAADKVSATAQNWVARFDSRLEAARAYLPIPPQMFDGWRAVPLVPAEALSATTPPTVTSTIFVTDPYFYSQRQPAANYRRIQPQVGFIHSPDGPPPAGTIPLYTLIFAADPSLLINSPKSEAELPAAPPAGSWPPPTNYQEILNNFRLEGYLEPNTNRGATVKLVGCFASDYPTWRPKFVTHVGGCPGRGTVETVIGYAFPTYPTRAQLASTFPIVTAVQQSPKENIAEHLIRATRVDPRLNADPDSLNNSLDALLRNTARAYNEDHPGILGNLVTSSTVNIDGFLSLIGSDRDAFLNTARRVTQTSMALGRGITTDLIPRGTVTRVIGTEERSDSAEGAYFQALAQRSAHIAQIASVDGQQAEPVLGAEADVGFFSIQQAPRGVHHTEAHLLSMLRDSRFRLRTGGRLPRALEALAAQLQTSLEGWARVQVTMGTAANTTNLVDSVKLSLTDLRKAPTSASEAAGTYEVWYSEAGLDCALGKRACNEADYKFPNLSATMVRAGLFELMLPARVAGTLRLPTKADTEIKRCVSNVCYLHTDKPFALYVTRTTNKPGKRKALLGFTLDGLHPVVQRNIWVGTGTVKPVQFIPFISGLPGEDVTETVAPDPQNPQDGETHCTGLDSTVKLEDELMEATNGQDDIESSFAYYLGVAADAASEADARGEELIAVGQAIDERSEIAREKLEELCGGVVNLESLWGIATAENKELGQILNDQEFVPNSPQLRADLAGLRNCLGVGPEHEPITAAVGSDTLCYWQKKYDPMVGGVRLPPCTAPSGVTPPSGNSCPFRASDCSTVYDGLGTQFEWKATQGNLGITTGLAIPSTAANTDARLIAAQRFSCVVRALKDNVTYPAARDVCVWDAEQDMSWVNHSVFGEIGSRLGVRLEPFYTAVITLDGREWLRLGQPDVGLSVPLLGTGGVSDLERDKKSHEWPCGGAPGTRTGWLPEFRAAIEEGGFPDPQNCENTVLCGVHKCYEDEFLISQKRLIKAVWGIKALGTAGFDDFEYYSLQETSQISNRWTTAIGMGSVPSWVTRNDLPWKLDFDWTYNYGVDTQIADGTWYRHGGGEQHGWCAPLAMVDPDGQPVFGCFNIAHGGIEAQRIGGIRAFDKRACVNSQRDDPTCGWVYEAITNPPGYSGNEGTVYLATAPNAPFAGNMHTYGFSLPSYQEKFSLSEVADMVELVAAASAQGGGLVGCSTTLMTSPTINGPEDFPKLGRLLECAGERVEGLVRDMFLTGVPKSVANTAAEQGVQHTLPAFRGRMGEAVGSLGGWIEAYAGSATQVARALRDVGRDFAVTTAQLNINDSNGDIARFTMISKISAAGAECAAAAANAGGNWASLNMGEKMAVGAVCVDAAVQTALAIKTNKAELDILDESRKLTLLDLADRISQRMDSIDDARRSLGEAHAQVSSVLSQIDSIRNQAAREVSKALGLETDTYGRVFPVNSVLRARYNTAQKRYEDALWRAKRAAQMARLALEQRVGKPLDEIEKDMSLVQAPKEWVNSLCSLKGIDYQRIRQGNTVTDEDPTHEQAEDEQAKGYNYAEQYIGDYVTKLERVKDSWGLDFPFQEGDDTVVISLRDDLVNARQACDVEGWNELLQTVHSLNYDVDETGVATQAWEGLCGDQPCASALPSVDEAPLTCYTDGGAPDLTCSSDGREFPDFGQGHTPQAVRLYAHATVDDAIPAEGLVLHLDARDISAANGAPLTSWPNRAGGAAAQVACSDNCVTYSAHGMYASGEPAVRLAPAGVSQVDKYIELGDLGQASEYTIVLTTQVDANSPSNVLWSNYPLTGSHAKLEHVINRNVSWVSDVGSLATSGVPDRSRADLVAIRVGAAARGGVGGTEVWRGGVLARDMAAAAPIRLGGILGKTNRTDTIPPGVYHYGAILMWNRALTDAELAQVQASLGRRYRIMPELPEGLASWLRADHCGVDFNNVLSCTDLAGARSPTATGATAPTLVANTINGAAVLRFDGNDVLTTTATRTGLTEHTTIAVARVTGSPNVVAPLVVSSNAQLYVDLPATEKRIAFGGTATGSVKLRTNTGAIAATPFVASVRGTGHETSIHVNGSYAVSSTGIAALSDNALRFGTTPGAFQGDIAEVLVFDRALDPDELLQVHTYLALRYAISMPGEVNDNLPIEDWTGEVASQYGQHVTVTPGSYWLSWYQRRDQTRLPVVLSSDDGAHASFDAMGSYTTAEHGDSAGSSYIHPDWVRHFGAVEVFTPGTLFVGWFVPSLPEGTAFAGAQLERSPDFLNSLPDAFFPTDADWGAPRALCEDHNGVEFRSAEFWTRGEELSCPLDDNTECADLAASGQLLSQPYYEIHFTISQEAIDEGRVLTQGGFARGNYNYRHRNLAVNLVGTAVKNCAQSAFPSTCYASNFLQYSLRHDGPYEVRTHDGGLFDADLFTGKIRQSKALLAERYLTNPMSSADRNLVGDFWSKQFRGRPLDGEYTLRIYEADGLDWNALEDVQIVLNYRYWTRLD